jgi:molybdopterin-guanine dinucleotide biosynthesis protein A
MAGGHILNYTRRTRTALALGRRQGKCAKGMAPVHLPVARFSLAIFQGQGEKPYETSNLIQEPAQGLSRPRGAGKGARPCGPSVAGWADCQVRQAIPAADPLVEAPATPTGHSCNQRRPRTCRRQTRWQATVAPGRAGTAWLPELRGAEPVGCCSGLRHRIYGRYRLSSGRNSLPVKHITAVILAGGRSQRMGGEDKGLVELAGKTMVDHVIERIRHQAGSVIINANRNLERYQAFGYPVVSDDIGDYSGPLAGMASAMRLADTDYLASVPCDSPLIPDDLVQRLYEALIRDGADISVAHDGVRMQPVCALLRRGLLPSLLDYLHAGGRKIDLWYSQHHCVTADFSDTPESFVNINTPQEHSRIGSGISRRAR